jgi:hypothetical protein
MLCETGQLDPAFFVPTGFCSSTHAYQTRQWDKALTFQASALNSAGRISARCIESFFASRISWWTVNRGSLPVCLRRLASILPSVQSIAIMIVCIAECRNSFDYQKFPPHPHAPGPGRIGCDGSLVFRHAESVNFESRLSQRTMAWTVPDSNTMLFSGMRPPPSAFAIMPRLATKLTKSSRNGSPHFMRVATLGLSR